MHNLPGESEVPHGKRRRRPRWILAVGGAIVAVGLLAAWTVEAILPDKQFDPQMVATVARGDIEDAVIATGTLQAFKQVNVGAQVSGELKVLHVGVGDSLRKGQPIAEIDAGTQRNALKQAAAQEAAARAQLRAKESTLAQNQLTLERQRGMYEEGASSREAYEAAEAAEASVRAEIDALKAHVVETSVALDTARLNLDYTKIQSPMDGVVVAVLAREGQTLNSSMSVPTIVKVAQIDKMRIRAEISEADVVRVSAGQPATFTTLGERERQRTAVLKGVELAPESAQGDPASGSGNALNTGTAIYYNGLLETPNDDHKLRIGMTVQVRIVLGAVQGVLTVPSAALGRQDAAGRRSVAVLSASGEVQQQWVTVGMSDKTNVHVIAGLKEGDRVLIDDRLGGDERLPSSAARESSSD